MAISVAITIYIYTIAVTTKNFKTREFKVHVQVKSYSTTVVDGTQGILGNFHIKVIIGDPLKSERNQGVIFFGCGWNLFYPLALQIA